MEQFTVYMQALMASTIAYLPKIALAAILLFVGWKVANRISDLAIKAYEKTSSQNQEIKSFLGSMVGIGLKVLLVITVAGIVGIETTSFVGIIAAMGFAVGLALQGNLSNFASGVLILLFHPFKTGDEVKIQGNWAFVKEIQIFHTILKQFDQTDIIVPNSLVMSGTITNYSNTPTRSLSIQLNIPFNEDLDKVMDIMKKAVYSIPTIEQDKEPFFWIQNFKDHYIQLSVMISALQEGFWNTDFLARKALIEAFVENNIKIAYPTGVTYGEFGYGDGSLKKVV